MDSEPAGGIDLHIHSTASDGTLSPAELLAMATHMGLEAMAITDHDTIDGVIQALDGGIPDRLKFLAGVEISTQPPPDSGLKGSLHLLGYGIDTDNPPLVQMLGRLQQARHQRTPKILARLRALGISIAMTDVNRHVGQQMAGRPHIAQAMISAGVVADVDQAFDRYLGKGCPAYVDKFRVDCGQACELIRQAGGIAVLAHPYLIGTGTDHVIEDLIKQLMPKGLGGIEVYYPNHPPAAVDHYLALAEKYHLVVTGGTDFHGDLTPTVRMGRGTGDLHVPIDVYHRLVNAVNAMPENRDR